jgi:hypothetical protein
MWNDCLMGVESPVWVLEMFWDSKGVMIVQHMNVVNVTELFTLILGCVTFTIIQILALGHIFKMIPIVHIFHLLWCQKFLIFTPEDHNLCMSFIHVFAYWHTLWPQT